MTARGSANLLTRTTAILATLFFVTAIGLTLLSEFDRGSSGILERASQGQEGGAAPTSVLDALNSLQSGAAPADGADAAPAQQQNTDAPDLAIPTQSAPELSSPAPAAPAAQTSVQGAPANSSAPAQPAAN